MFEVSWYTATSPRLLKGCLKKYYAQTYYIHVQYTCTEAMQIKVKVLFMHWSPCT